MSPELFELKGSIVCKTDRAIGVAIPGDGHQRIVFIPLSQVHSTRCDPGGSGQIWISAWFAKKKGLIS